MRPWSIEECAAYAQQLRDKNRACTAEHAAQAIEYLLGLAQPEQEPVAVPQFRVQGCSDWYDGYPDYSDGTGAYETRTLYTSPQPAQKKPVAWMTFTAYGEEDDVWYENPEGKLLEGWTYKPLYDTTPPRREWVGLTEHEQEVLWDEAVDRREHFCSQYGDFADAIEAKLKEKNNAN